MSAATYDFEIEQGSTLIRPIVWKDSSGNPINLSGYSAKMQVRQSVSSDDVLLELSTANGKITLGTTNGTITLVLTATETAAIQWRSGRYDLELTSSGSVVTRLLQGVISISKEVTRG